MTDHLPPEIIREVEAVLEQAWAEEMHARQATDERLRKAQETMTSAERMLAQLSDAETERLAADLAAWKEFRDGLPPDARGC